MSWIVNKEVYIVRYDKYPYDIVKICLTKQDAIDCRKGLDKKINFIDGEWDQNPIKFDIIEAKLFTSEALEQYVKTLCLK